MQIHQKKPRFNKLARLITSLMLATTLAIPLGSGGVTAASDPGTWTATASLPSNVLGGYTSTVLANGKVLVAGGVDSHHEISQAELYDPSTNTWTLTGSMNVARANHSAVLLANGKVLVTAGNIGPYAPTNTAELYDPATGIWTFTGSLHVARLSSSAIRLENGQVLQISGWYGGSSGLIPSCELYDPATGTWSYTGSVITPRLGHSSVLLHDGRVLVASGNTDGAPTTASELYDPATGTWSATGSLSVPRASGTPYVVLQDGRVLAMGSIDSYSPTPNFFSSAELYNPSTGVWTPTGSMSTPRYTPVASLLPNGQVLVAGGMSSPSGYLASTERYDPATGTWTPDAPMTTPRAQPNISVLTNGSVLVMGGNDAASQLTSTELYTQAPTPYNWSGFLPPTNADGSSIFKLGRTVPVKFQLTGPDASVIDAQAHLYVTKLTDNVEGTIQEADSTAAADTGNLFRYDPTAGQYIFNLDTKNLTAGTYRLKVYVKGDSTTGVLQGEVNISLR